jgi:hypothetical protein
MEPVFLRNGRYAAHVGLWLRPLLGYFGEESFKSRGSSIDEHANRLIGIIFETVNRAARGVDAIAGREHGPGSIKEKINLPLYDIEPFVFAFVVMRPRPVARRTDIEKSREVAPKLAVPWNAQRYS